MGVLINQNQEIQKSMEFISGQYEELLLKVGNLEHENVEYRKRVANLEGKLEVLERKTISSTIEIRNIPKQNNENKQILTDIVKNVGTALSLDMPIMDQEVRDIYRSKSEAIVIDFTSTNRKESLLTSFRYYNKSCRTNKKPQLNTQNINLPGMPRAVFVSEFLTNKARRLYYIARENVKNKKLLAAWTSFGKVYIKKEENQRPIRVENEVDISQIIL
ncbi:uncharacterized protein LOC128201709 [Galleria mellonella]|uniref:Uncharacterized protein LOC128201709 n=1 Tax=Galleria mellonella TaxID=7137 RepID=A0ABM3MVJ0_GALME|nr:uncharacterized protein LOC128201709 [Galleria mellonella]